MPESADIAFIRIDRMRMPGFIYMPDHGLGLFKGVKYNLPALRFNRINFVSPGILVSHNAIINQKITGWLLKSFNNL